MLLVLFLCHLAISFASPTHLSEMEQHEMDLLFSKLRAHPRSPITRSEIDVTPTTVAASTVASSQSKYNLLQNLLFSEAEHEISIKDQATFQDEVAFMQRGIDVVRQDVDEWMTPRRRMMLSFLLGAASIFAMIIVYKLLQYFVRLYIRLRNREYKVSGMFRSPHSADKDKLLKDVNRTSSDFGDITI